VCVCARAGLCVFCVRESICTEIMLIFLFILRKLYCTHTDILMQILVYLHYGS